MKGPVVKLTDIQVRTRRGEELFNGLQFTLEPGRSAVICGGAGSGKTTLAELIIGGRFPFTGTVEVFGEPVRRGRSMRKIRRKIGGVGGPFGLVPALTVEENILMPLIIAGENRDIQQERLTKILAEFSLHSQAGQTPHSLTRVENTLVQIARASVAYQPLMVIDEPAAGLDARTYDRVLDFLTNASLSGRSLIILASDKPPRDIPNSDYYEINRGVLT